jgi:hypothetical protein
VNDACQASQNQADDSAEGQGDQHLQGRGDGRTDKPVNWQLVDQADDCIQVSMLWAE